MVVYSFEFAVELIGIKARDREGWTVAPGRSLLPRKALSEPPAFCYFW